MFNNSTVVGFQANENTSSNPEKVISDAAHTRDMVVLTILGVMIAAINGLILISFLMRPHLRKRPANIMICSQACTDLFTGLVYVPVYLTKSEGMVNFLNIYMLYLSLFNLAIISVDRYLAMNRPFIHRRLINVNRTLKMIVGVWVCPLVLALIPLSFLHMSVYFRAMKIYISIVWLLMLVLVVSMSVLYIYASKGAKRTIQSRRTSFQNSRVKVRAQLLARKELRVVNLFGLLLFFFVGAYLPILYINFCWLIGIQFPPVMLPISLYLLIVNSVLNPILCIMLKKDFLYAIKKIILTRYGFADQMSNTSRCESDFDLSMSGTPIFNRRGTFRKKDSENDQQRQRMVSDQLDYSSRSPSLKKTGNGNGRRQRMISDQSDYTVRSPMMRRTPERARRPCVPMESSPKRITRQGPYRKRDVSGAQGHEENNCTSDTEMERITEKDECCQNENI